MEETENPRLASLMLCSLLPLSCADSEDVDRDEPRGGPVVPPVCSACQYGTAQFAVSSSDLSGGTLSTATALTDVTHTTCPYSGYGDPCTASVDFNVKCLINGPVAYTVGYTPNGSTTGSTTTGEVELVIALTGGGTKRVRKALTVGSPYTSTQPSTLVCGGTPDIDIAD